MDKSIPRGGDYFINTFDKSNDIWCDLLELESILSSGELEQQSESDCVEEICSI
jgi:hypothetical protein